MQYLTLLQNVSVTLNRIKNLLNYSSPGVMELILFTLVALCDMFICRIRYSTELFLPTMLSNFSVTSGRFFPCCHCIGTAFHRTHCSGGDMLLGVVALVALRYLKFFAVEWSGLRCSAAFDR